MSYGRPQDPYIHSNASQYDDRYQPGAYRDEAADYYTQPQGSHGGYGHSPGASEAYKDYASSHYNLHDAGTGAAGAAAPMSAPNYAQQSAQKYSYAPPKKGVSKWVKIGIPVAIIVIAGAVLGGYFGSKASKDSASKGTSAMTGSTSGDKTPTVSNSILTAASEAAKRGGGDDLVFQGTDLYGNPSFKNNAVTAAPAASGKQIGNCAADTFSGSTSNLRDHPRIMTTQGQWDCLADKIANDAYLTVWNATIFDNATAFYKLDPTAYAIDGGLSGSGILDPAREVQLRMKTFGYAYRMTKDTKWRDRAWTELQTAAGNNTQVVWGGQPNQRTDRIWNPTHFLDTAELTAAFAIGYDWFYDAWTDDQRSKIRASIITQGLVPGMNAYSSSDDGKDYQWWQQTNGNWNCVCNSGLLLGALAIATEDTTGFAQNIITNVIPNMKGNCMQGVYDDGTWSETANYWYFGTNAAARAVSALTTATGSDQGLMAANTNFAKTALFHMYISGNAGMFFYGDHGPNKYSTNANGMFLWSSLAKEPTYALFQRDRADAADPLSMFWYDTTNKGAFWNGLPLDNFFNNTLGSWASMRSSWTDFTGTYVAIKSSNATGHQTHGDLDAGDFVIDALGTRWAGEFGSANYLSTDYFASEANNALRWQYYRKGTQGQNTLVINNANQNADCHPINNFETTSPKQSADINYAPGTNDVAYFTTDMSDAYNLSSGTVQRGIRFLNGRRQVLVQDEIGANSGINTIEWRVHTNATVTVSADGKSATLTLSQVTDPNAWGGNEVIGPQPLVAKFSQQTMKIKMLQPTDANVKFTTEKPDNRIYGSDPNQASGEQGDQPNPDVTAISIKLDGGSAQQIQVVWQPQWSDMQTADSADPKSVALASWSLTSHN
ncbi:hypothetical protein FA10DRAFT_268997 [Acaromyces ingoldii]|uniref:Heparinase II/III-like C-terminal domain-containing protein n=1 Tax=Acaromyces ingoldii TaxID=215250 RepID=A0A316YDE8_9BASI|nr:hypothetical protein FA10DRAFT_268997 [Acaromyces ingoldii]PWN87670.1 hypothetical protein FA10DRAFT_268997 [Acaromyces ingoldii]